MPAISCSSLFPLKRLGSAVRSPFKAPEERAGFELSPWRCVELLQEGRRKCRHRDSERSQGVIQGSRQTHFCPALGELPLLEAGWDHPPTHRPLLGTALGWGRGRRGGAISASGSTAGGAAPSMTCFSFPHPSAIPSWALGKVNAQNSWQYQSHLCLTPRFESQTPPLCHLENFNTCHPVLVLFYFICHLASIIPLALIQFAFLSLFILICSRYFIFPIN